MASLHEPTTRYKCLVAQTRCLRTLSRLYDLAYKSLAVAGKPKVIESKNLFGVTHPVSCTDLVNMLPKTPKDSAAILEGPLHILDYWDESQQKMFWEQLANYSHGPALIVVDVYRQDKSFVSVFKNDISEIDGTRLLKSRLAY